MSADLLFGSRIFIVDDQEPNRRLLDRILTRAGFTNLRSFADGASALAAFERDEPDAILLDLHMPGMDGFAVLAALGKIVAEDDFLPIVVLSGDVERDARARALSIGATDFLTKPLDAEEVLLRVRNHLRTRLLHRAVLLRNIDLTSEVTASAQALTDLEEGWAAVAASLGRLTVQGSPEATADAICREIATLPDLDAVGLLAFGAGQTTIPLGLAMPYEVGLAVNVPLPNESSTALRARASGGPWVEAWSVAEDDPPYRIRLRDAGLAGAAYLPLTSDAGLLGLLVAGSSRADAVERLTRGLPALEAFAALASALLAPGIAGRQHDNAIRTELTAVIADHTSYPVFQPMVELTTGQTIGFEALSRFADGARPDRRFADAAAVGLGLELESATLAAALGAARDLPSDAFVSLNVSPDLVLAGDRLAVLLAEPPRSIVLEITEHMPVADYPALRRALEALGPVRFAIDDAGAGYSSFRHIVELGPEFVKIDIGLVRAIERDPARQAFVAGMVYFALRTGCTLIAEGIETIEERGALEQLGVDLGQGYLLGRPERVGEWATTA